MSKEWSKDIPIMVAGAGRSGLNAVRLLQKEDDLVLRFRDDCGAFDPVSYIPRDGKDALGIRLVLAFAQDVRYTYALNLNNLCIRIGKEEDPAT